MRRLDYTAVQCIIHNRQPLDTTYVHVQHLAIVKVISKEAHAIG